MVKNTSKPVEEVSDYDAVSSSEEEDVKPKKKVHLDNQDMRNKLKLG